MRQAIPIALLARREGPASAFLRSAAPRVLAHRFAHFRGAGLVRGIEDAGATDSKKELLEFGLRRVNYRALVKSGSNVVIVFRRHNVI